MASDDKTGQWVMLYRAPCKSLSSEYVNSDYHLYRKGFFYWVRKWKVHTIRRSPVAQNANSNRRRHWFLIEQNSSVGLTTKLVNETIKTTLMIMKNVDDQMQYKSLMDEYSGIGNQTSQSPFHHYHPSSHYCIPVEWSLSLFWSGNSHKGGFVIDPSRH